VIVSLLGDSFISFVHFSVCVCVCVCVCFWGPFGSSSRLKERGDTFLREHILGCWWRCCCVVCLLLVPGNFSFVGFGGFFSPPSLFGLQFWFLSVFLIWVVFLFLLAVCVLFLLRYNTRVSTSSVLLWLPAPVVPKLGATMDVKLVWHCRRL